MQPGRKIYFLSDFHLGAPDAESSLVREKRITAFLDEAAKDAAEIILLGDLGDLFDFWFEWKKAVPRGFTRLLGKLAELTDRGLPVHLFIGNHDMWIFDYLPKETGVVLHREPVVREIGGKRFLIGHGDGLGPGDHGYKFIKQVFRNPVCQWLFARLHPNFALWLGDFWSGRSRKKSYENDRKWLGADKEWLVQYCILRGIAAEGALRLLHFRPPAFTSGHGSEACCRVPCRRPGGSRKGGPGGQAYRQPCSLH